MSVDDHGLARRYLRKLSSLTTKFQQGVAQASLSAREAVSDEVKTCGGSTQYSSCSRIPSDDEEVLVLLNGGVQSAVPPHRLRMFLLNVMDSSESPCASSLLGPKWAWDIQVHFAQRHTFAFASLIITPSSASSAEQLGEIDSQRKEEHDEDAAEKLRLILTSFKHALLCRAAQAGWSPPASSLTKGDGNTKGESNGEKKCKTSAAGDPVAASSFFVLPDKPLVAWQASSSSTTSSSDSDVTPLYCCWCPASVCEQLILPSDGLLIPYKSSIWDRRTCRRTSERSSAASAIAKKANKDDDDDDDSEEVEEPCVAALRREVVLSESSWPCFLVAVPDVPGLYIATNFISRREHDALFRFFNSSVCGGDAESEPHVAASSTGTRVSSWVPLAKRHVIHINRRFIYGSNTVGDVGDGAMDMPRWASQLHGRLSGTSAASLFADEDYVGVPCDEDGGDEPFLLPRGWPIPVDCVFDQMTVNKYHMFNLPVSCHEKSSDLCPSVDDRHSKEQQGAEESFAGSQKCSSASSAGLKKQKLLSSGIAPHVDAHSPFGDFILSLSIGSYTVVNFRSYSPSPSSSSSAVANVLLPPRSLMIMSGQARYAYTHGIQEKPSDILSDVMAPMQRGLRFSVTMRQARLGPAHRRDTCMCPELCDAEPTLS